MGILLLYLSLALGISFLCSILEAVLLSTPLSFIAIKESEGKNVKTLKEQKSNIDKPISAILSLNTIAHTVGAAGVGAQAVEVFGEAYFGVISAVLTVLILILSEIIPKTIGATYWRKLAIPSSKTIQVLIYICYPLVWISEFITRLISSDNSDERTVSREELTAMADAGVKEGVLETNESRIIQNVMRLEQVQAREVMTPRSVTATAIEDETVREFFLNKTLLSYSRIPLYNSSAENERYITGYVLLRDVLSLVAEDKFDVKLQDIKRPIIAISETESVSSAWEKLLEHKEHIALVVDEYGSLEGVITLEDIVETILGLEILDEKDTVADMQQLAKQKWEARIAKYKQLI